jgi:hypothetical protein
MLPCPVCGDPLLGDRERIGARCPTCREPLYEQDRDPHRLAADGSRCVKHPNNGAAGTCQRCGNYLCNICWSRWHDQSLCAACVERALQGGEATPTEARGHLLQAVLAVVFGVIAWLTTIGTIVMIVAGVQGENEFLAGVGMIVFLASPVPAVVGMGQGVAAIRARGNHMIMATIGLILSGLHAGMMVGLFTVSVWVQVFVDR